jgi:hypothetical protein
MAVAIVLGGCAAPVAPNLDSPLASARLKASREVDPAVVDERQIRALIESLDHPDSAVRRVAIDRLEGVAGDRFGYDPAGPVRQREDAIAAWVRWFNDRFAPDRHGGVGDGANG